MVIRVGFALEKGVEIVFLKGPARRTVQICEGVWNAAFTFGKKISENRNKEAKKAPKCYYCVSSMTLEMTFVSFFGDKKMTLKIPFN